MENQTISQREKEVFMDSFPPTTFSQAKAIDRVLRSMITNKSAEVFLLFTMIYIWKQTFAIPGSALLNVLAGALLREYAFLYCSVLTASGSTLCFMWSKFVGPGILLRVSGQGKLAILKQKVEEHKDNLFFYLLFARMFPFTPNWLISLSSP
jgi:uncharacterized membrane protein YdjX (TVP38/TMEM64 family)